MEINWIDTPVYTRSIFQVKPPMNKQEPVLSLVDTILLSFDHLLPPFIKQLNENSPHQLLLERVPFVKEFTIQTTIIDKLAVACKYGESEYVDKCLSKLLIKKLDINWPPKFGINSILPLATQSGNVEIVRKLLAAGITVTLTALLEAVINKQTNIINELIAAGANIDKVFHNCLQRNDITLLQICIDNDTNNDINIAASLFTYLYYCGPPRDFDQEVNPYASPQILQFLIDNGADVDWSPNLHQSLKLVCAALF